MTKTSDVLVSKEPRWKQAAWRERGSYDNRRICNALRQGDRTLVEAQVISMQLDQRMAGRTDREASITTRGYDADLVYDFERKLREDLGLPQRRDARPKAPTEVLDSRPAKRPWWYPLFGIKEQ